MSSIIELKNIHKNYVNGDVITHVLQDISLSVNKGETISIMGASGSGKSTLMNIIGLLDKPTEGEYLLLGQPVINYSDNELSKLRNKTMGFVFQSFFLLPRLNAVENVSLPLLYRGISAHEAKDRSLAMLEKVGMANRANHKSNELSGGQQQRVAIARALVGQPDIIIADEPTGALDSKTSQEVLDLLLNLYSEDGSTAIIVTHDEGVAKQCHRMVHIKDGLLVDS